MFHQAANSAQSDRTQLVTLWTANPTQNHLLIEGLSWPVNPTNKLVKIELSLYVFDQVGRSSNKNGLNSNPTHLLIG